MIYEYNWIFSGQIIHRRTETLCKVWKDLYFLIYIYDLYDPEWASNIVSPSAYCRHCTNYKSDWSPLKYQESYYFLVNPQFVADSRLRRPPPENRFEIAPIIHSVMIQPTAGHFWAIQSKEYNSDINIRWNLSFYSSSLYLSC